MNNPPRVLLWLEIPANCRMAASLNCDDQLRFHMEDPFKEELTIVFDRRALERFVQLASNALRLEQPEDTKFNLPELVSTS